MRKHAFQIFRAALEGADPYAAVLRHLHFDGQTLTAGRRRYRMADFDRIQVIGAGKASAAMARAVERVLGRRITGGLVNVPDGTSTRLRRVDLNQAGHPIPDERGQQGAQRILEIACAAGPRDLLICVISGGASALLPAPIAGYSLAAKQETTRQLLNAGATIQELNTVRKHLSLIKGGQLGAAAYPARLITLILSDVIGDDLGVIGSGPTVGDSSTAKHAESVLDKYGVARPVLRETPKPGDPQLGRVQNLIVGSNRLAMDAAASKAKELGYRTLVLSSSVDGETREIARMHAAIVKEILTAGRPVRRPACLLSGGETTVTVRGKGLGGRNQEFVLATAIALEGQGPVTIFSGGTDGLDGPTDAAGAIADERTPMRDAPEFLDNNDSYHFFEKLDALVKTGPTGTNVMDVRILLVPA
ncbi:MAG: glycerate kinase [Acidobacteriia bacterium]|nr:glycerate kinase [Terriglobia bacterium]